MKRRPTILPIAAAVLTLSATAPAAAAPVIDGGWVRQSIPGQTLTAAYPLIRNSGAARCWLQEVTSPAAARVEMHTHSHSQGSMQMRKLEALAVDAGATAVFGPGGKHLMLLDLAEALVPGDEVALTFDFGACGTVTAGLPVRALN